MLIGDLPRSDFVQCAIFVVTCSTMEDDFVLNIQSHKPEKAKVCYLQNTLNVLETARSFTSL